MDTEPVELSGGLLKLLIGFWLLLPLQSFQSSITFTALAVVPEWAWGAFLVVVGIGHLAALCDGSPPWRRAASLVGFLTWFTFAAIFVHSNPAAFGWAAFAVIAGQQGWAYIRLGQLMRFRTLGGDGG